MSIVVEDGTIVENANSYISIQDADSYFDDFLRPDAWIASDATVKSKALITATSYIDFSFNWNGVKSTSAQLLEWPRKFAYDKRNSMGENDLYDAYDAYNAYDAYSIYPYNGIVTQLGIPIDFIPRELKKAVCEQAAIMIDVDILASPEIGIKNATVGSIKVEFDKTDRVIKPSKRIRQLLAGIGTVMRRAVKIRRA